MFETYIKLIVLEQRSARVPTQLIDKNSDEEEENGIEEFNGVGAVAGYTLPLGMQPKKKR